MRYEFGECTVDTTTYEIWRNGELASVEPQVFDLLVLFLQNRDRLVSKDEILERIWGGRIVSEAALSSRISSLRQLIGDDGTTQSFIRTVRGRGFRVIGEVRERPATASQNASDAPTSPTGTNDVTFASISELELNSSPEAETEQVAMRPGVAVLPFVCLGGEAQCEHFAFALVDDITSALSRMRTFLLVARGAASAYGGRETDVREIARILGVRYVVQGSVRLFGQSLRVCVQLNDAVHREEIWAGNFDSPFGEMTETSDKMTDLIVGVLQPTLLIAEIQRALHRQSENLTAYEITMRAMPKCWALNKRACSEAMILLQQALQQEPEHSLAIALLSWCHGQQVVYNWTKDVAFHRARALELAQRAAGLDENDPLVLIKLANAECVAGDLPSAAVHIKRALDLDPYFSWAWTRCGYIKSHMGKDGPALEDFERALRLSPFEPMRFNTYMGMANAHFVAGRYVEAISYIEQALLERPDIVWAHRILASCSALVGDIDTATKSRTIFENHVPGVGASDIINAVPHQSPEIRERFRSALLSAGFKP
jgi:adenylate cyclase